MTPINEDLCQPAVPSTETVLQFIPNSGKVPGAVEVVLPGFNPQEPYLQTLYLL